MPARLTVVISQSPRRDGRAVDLEESLITQLMLAPGMDTIVVKSLDLIELDSTDHLCLQDSPPERVLVGWLSFEEAVAAWRSLELNGTFQKLDENATPSQFVQLGNPASRVRYIQLSPGSLVEQVLAVVQRVLNNRRTQTINIQLPGSPSLIATHPPLPSVRELPQSPSKDRAGSFTSVPNSPSHPPSAEGTPKQSGLPSPATQGGDVSDDQWQAIDKLVDDLDELNI